MRFCATLIILALLYVFSAEPANALTCIDLDGAYVYSQEPRPVYLGFFGNEYASESIMNEYGTYGSSYSSFSVRNSYGTYGSAYSSYSANNDYTSTAPKVFKNGQLIAYLTTNTYTYGGVSLAQIDVICTFYSSSPAIGGSQPPPPPTSIIASDGLYDNKIFVTWGSVDGATSYFVYYAESFSGTKHFLGSTTATSIDVVNLISDHVYYFWVSAANAYVEGPLSNPDSGYVKSTPADESAPEPRYRLYNANSGHHHYTTNSNEYSVLGSLGWAQEGISCYLYNGTYQIGTVQTAPYYRLYNPNSGEHHWTTDANEYQFLGTIGWRQEGVDGHVFASQVTGSQPLYRLYNPNAGLHHWTMDANERSVIIGYGWKDEGIACYVFP